MNSCPGRRVEGHLGARGDPPRRSSACSGCALRPVTSARSSPARRRARPRPRRATRATAIRGRRRTARAEPHRHRPEASPQDDDAPIASSSSSSSNSGPTGEAPMLSRIAESLFWIGRYIERSDGTARILDVHLQLLLEDPWIEEDIACRALSRVMGSEANRRRRARPRGRARAARRRPRPAGVDRLLARRRARERAPRARDRLDRALGGAQHDERAHAASRRARQGPRVLPLGARARRARRGHRRLGDEPRRGVAASSPSAARSSGPT